jgi:hypothetical protein
VTPLISLPGIEVREQNSEPPSQPAALGPDSRLVGEGFPLLDFREKVTSISASGTGGIRGFLVQDEAGLDVVYMLCEPASHYFRVMTRSDRMPVLIGERY